MRKTYYSVRLHNGNSRIPTKMSMSCIRDCLHQNLKKVRAMRICFFILICVQQELNLPIRGEWSNNAARLSFKKCDIISNFDPLLLLKKYQSAGNEFQTTDLKF